MDLWGADAVDAAFDALTVHYEHLLKLLEDGGLEAFDDARFLGFLQGFERFRNRFSLVDHQGVQDAQRRDLAGELCHSTVPRALAATLRISPAEAGRRVRAADVLTERSSMTGQPLAPVRPYLAAAQRDGEVSAEQVDIVERALAKVGRVGFDPDQVAWGEQQLAGWAAQFGPKDLTPAGRTGRGRDRPGRHPARRPAAGRPAAFHAASDAGRWVCGGVPVDRRGRGEAAGGAGAVGEAADQCRPRPAMGGGSRSPTTGPMGSGCTTRSSSVCDRLLRTDTAVPDAGGTPATVIITLDLADLLDKTGYAVASDGTLIPTEKALDLADQAEIYFAAVNAHGVPLQLGRTRRIAGAGLNRRPDRPRQRMQHSPAVTPPRNGASGITSSRGARAG